MSALTQCDWCEKALPNSADEVRNDWIVVEWKSNGINSDYCTTACAVAGLEKARADDAEAAMQALEQYEEDERG